MFTGNDPIKCSILPGLSVKKGDPSETGLVYTVIVKVRIPIAPDAFDTYFAANEARAFSLLASLSADHHSKKEPHTYKASIKRKFTTAEYALHNGGNAEPLILTADVKGSAKVSIVAGDLVLEVALIGQIADRLMNQLLAMVGQTPTIAASTPTQLDIWGDADAGDVGPVKRSPDTAPPAPPAA